MKSYFFDFPNEKDWNNIYDLSPFPRIFKSLDDLTESLQQNNNTAKRLTLYFHINTYFEDLHHKLDDTIRAHIFMMYYFNKGIHDDRAIKFASEKGENTEFYPDMSEEQAITKSWFDFYTDITYYKLFSVWDMLGHILMIILKLNITEKVYFSTVAKAVKQKDKILSDKLIEVINSRIYKETKHIRNNITHNLLPNNPGFYTKLKETSPTGAKTYQVEMKEYIPSKIIINNIQKNLNLFEKTINHINQHLKNQQKMIS